MHLFSFTRTMKVAAATFTVALAVAAAALAAGSRTSTTSLTFTGVQVASSMHFVDQLPKGESAGDTITFSQVLYTGKRRVGFAEVSGTLLDNSRHDADNLTGTLILENGTIVLQGTSIGTTATQHLAIVGGTGAYAGKRGEAVITNGQRSSTLRLGFGR
jgi:hypothetical protein